MQLKIYLYHPSSQTNGISFSPCPISPPPTPLGTPQPYNLQGCETFFLKKLKINYVLTNFSLPGIQTLMKINSGCEYFTLCESFDAKNSTGTPYACACRPINFKCIYRDKILIFPYFLFAIVSLSNDIITATSRKTVRISPIDYTYLGLTVRH